MRIEDKIDPTVGFMAEVKIGDQVSAGQTLGLVYCRDESRAQEAASGFRRRTKLAKNLQRKLPTLMKEVINE